MVGLVSRPALARQESAIEACRLHPADLATRLRRLALDTYRVARDRQAAPSDAVELCRQIEELREHARGAGLSEIERWLQKASEVLIDHAQA